jgi:CubicO group peptidase (beta-lactamase class C family)
MEMMLRRLAVRFGLNVDLLGSCDVLRRALAVPVHFTSHQLCSAVFVAGLDPTEFYREAIAPKSAPMRSLMNYEIDRERRQVRVSLAGLLHSIAVDEGPYGCRVIHSNNGSARNDMNGAVSFATVRPPSASPDLVAPGSAALSSALDHVFTEPESGPHRWTKAVVIFHRGCIVGERYAPGVTASTPLIGWSMTKSFTNALLGILVHKGKLEMTAPAPIAEWSAPDDPRRGITSDQLLRMISGLNGGESLNSGWNTIFDADTQMEFDVADQAGVAARARLRALPGVEFHYTNYNFILLSRIIRDAAGGDRASTRQFIERELLVPLGIEQATLEYDSAGSPLGTIHLWASARDWGRLGLLYLRDGVSPTGQRILPEGWVEYSARLTPQSDEYGYGAGFWTLRGNSSGGCKRIAAGLPADSFMAFGSPGGQYTIVIPSEDLVIVKIGWSYTPNDDFEAVARLVRETIAALHADR